MAFAWKSLFLTVAVLATSQQSLASFLPDLCNDLPPPSPLPLFPPPLPSINVYGSALPPSAGIYGPPPPPPSIGIYGPPPPPPSIGMYGPPPPPPMHMYGPSLPSSSLDIYGPQLPSVDIYGPPPSPMGIYGPSPPPMGIYGPSPPPMGIYGHPPPSPSVGLYGPSHLGLGASSGLRAYLNMHKNFGIGVGAGYHPHGAYLNDC